jgi:hypothetical protein
VPFPLRRGWLELCCCNQLSAGSVTLLLQPTLCRLCNSAAATNSLQALPRSSNWKRTRTSAGGSGGRAPPICAAAFEDLDPHPRLPASRTSSCCCCFTLHSGVINQVQNFNFIGSTERGCELIVAAGRGSETTGTPFNAAMRG